MSWENRCPEQNVPWYTCWDVASGLGWDTLGVAGRVGSQAPVSQEGCGILTPGDFEQLASWLLPHFLTCRLRVIIPSSTLTTCPWNLPDFPPTRDLQSSYMN